MNMMNVCRKMPSEVRLEKGWGTSVDERAIDYKILNFEENFPCCPNFPCVVPKIPCVFPVCKN